MSSIKAIAIRQKPRAAMQLVERARITLDAGIVGDFRGAQRGRQITILSESAWRKACADIDADLPWTTRRANLLVDGVDFDERFVGQSVRIGEVELVVTGETDPCSRMDEQHPGLTAALMPNWRGGICCDVVNPGEIKIGDRIDFV